LQLCSILSDFFPSSSAGREDSLHTSLQLEIGPSSGAVCLQSVVTKRCLEAPLSLDFISQTFGGLTVPWPFRLSFCPGGSASAASLSWGVLATFDLPAWPFKQSRAENRKKRRRKETPEPLFCFDLALPGSLGLHLVLRLGLILITRLGISAVFALISYCHSL
jgi:hypothetical protein